MIYEFGKGLNEAKREFLAKSYTNLDIEKGGEGSRGGKIIGHTKSGKAIYEKAIHGSHEHFSSEDHAEAAKLHNKLSKEKYTKSAELTKKNNHQSSEESSDLYRQYRKHIDQAELHNTLKRHTAEDEEFSKKNKK